MHAIIISLLAHRRYAECVTQRQEDREEFRRQHRRGRQNHFTYLNELKQSLDFGDWVLEEVRKEQLQGTNVDADIVDTARGPLHVATTYKSMHAYGNYYRVCSSEQALRTTDSGMAATFRQVCRNGIRDSNQVNADMKYVGHIEEILELNYRRHCLVVLVCDFVKANYVGENATIKKDKWGFTLANYRRRYGNICCDSFAFLVHCEQMFYFEATKAPGWRVVLRKEVRGKRVLPNNGEDVEAQLFEMGADEDFHGLRPERKVGEEQIPAAPMRENVILAPVRRPRRQLRRGAVQVNE